jgi:hypothetical protein
MLHGPRDRTRGRFWKSIAVCAALSLGGCDAATGVRELCVQCQGGGSPSPVTSFALSPDSAHILRGDTVTFYTWSCDGGYICGLGGNKISNWSVGGVAAAALVGGMERSAVDNVSQIVARGVVNGTSDVTAVSVNEGSVRTVPLHVVDSLAITQIDLTTAYRADYPVSMGTVREMTARLRNAAGSHVRGRPTLWSVSDTSILRVVRSQALGGFESRMVVVPKKPGTSDVSATFLGVTAVVRVTVVP